MTHLKKARLSRPLALSPSRPLDQDSARRGANTHRPAERRRHATARDDATMPCPSHVTRALLSHARGPSGSYPKAPRGARRSLTVRLPRPPPRFLLSGDRLVARACVVLVLPPRTPGVCVCVYTYVRAGVRRRDQRALVLARVRLRRRAARALGAARRRDAGLARRQDHGERSRWGVGWGSPPRARLAAFGGRDPRGSRSAPSAGRCFAGAGSWTRACHWMLMMMMVVLLLCVALWCRWFRACRRCVAVRVCDVCDLPCFLLRCRARSAAASPRRARSSDSTRPSSRRPASDPPTRRRGVIALSPIDRGTRLEVARGSPRGPVLSTSAHLSPQTPLLRTSALQSRVSAPSGSRDGGCVG